MTTRTEVERVAEFRNRLVAYMNLVLSARTGYHMMPIDEDAREKIASAQPWLATEYGRLFKVINRWGGMSMSSRAAGITSYDVIQDAIHNIGDVYYDDIARYAVRHLDTVSGRLQADFEEEADGPHFELDHLYRFTSPVYWLGRLLVFGRWLLGTSRGRVAGVVSLLVVATVSGIVSGVAQAWFQQVTAHH